MTMYVDFEAQRGNIQPSSLSHGIYGPSSSMCSIGCGSYMHRPGQKVAHSLSRIPKVTYFESLGESATNEIDPSLLCGFDDTVQQGDSIDLYVSFSVANAKAYRWYLNSGVTNHGCHDAFTLN